MCFTIYSELNNFSAELEKYIYIFLLITNTNVPVAQWSVPNFGSLKVSVLNQNIARRCRAEICPPVQFYFKKLNYKKSGGIFVKLVDCGGCLVNLASTEYRSITEKFKGFFHKIDGLQNHFNKVQGFFYKIHGIRHDY